MADMRQGISPQDRAILEELIATGAMKPNVTPDVPGNLGAIQAALQNAPLQGGMVPTNVHSEPPALATPAENRIGVGPAQLGDVQDPLMQQLMMMQPQPGSPVQSNMGPPPVPMSPAQRAGMMMPGAGAPGQAPLPPELLAAMRR